MSTKFMLTCFGIGLMLMALTWFFPFTTFLPAYFLIFTPWLSIIMLGGLGKVTENDSGFKLRDIGDFLGYLIAVSIIFYLGGITLDSGTLFYLNSFCSYMIYSTAFFCIYSILTHYKIKKQQKK